jgi:hypothetical protein
LDNHGYASVLGGSLSVFCGGYFSYRELLGGFWACLFWVIGGFLVCSILQVFQNAYTNAQAVFTKAESVFKKEYLFGLFADLALTCFGADKIYFG